MTERKNMSRSPSQNWGMETPETAPTMEKVSTQVPWRKAEKNPKGMPMPAAISIATRANLTVGQIREAMSALTFSRRRYERPKSPTARFFR